jgi:hypothetical protein
VEGVIRVAMIGVGKRIVVCLFCVVENTVCDVGDLDLCMLGVLYMLYWNIWCGGGVRIRCEVTYIAIV